MTVGDGCNSGVRKKIAIVLVNLGGPDKLSSVKPFLFTLFNDPLIIRLPQPIRFLFAKLISSRRDKKAQAIYAKLGGKSPLLENTKNQALALEEKLKKHFDVSVHIAMRYWHPFAKEVVDVAEKADEIVFLPLYPQFSTTTTLSSLREWDKIASKPYRYICCYPENKHFIRAHVKLLKQTVSTVESLGDTRVLFVAHGLPQDIIDGGDPYQDQISQTVSAVIDLFPISDYTICFQSRVGPKKWLSPSIEDEIIRAGSDKKDVVVVPISFVSENSETLVELDMDMLDLAKRVGVKNYYRVPTLQNTDEYTVALEKLVLDSLKGKKMAVACSEGSKCCRWVFKSKKAIL